MRRWPILEAPKDGTVIVGCTRVEGVEHRMRWDADRPGWVDTQSGLLLPSDLFTQWRRSDPVD
jgi:hypothetical protein